jgi:hypothetical protein
MSHQAIPVLAQMLQGQVGLGKRRLETLCMLVVGMIGARTVTTTPQTKGQETPRGSHLAVQQCVPVLAACSWRRAGR